MSDLSKICFEVEPDIAKQMEMLSDPRERLAALTAYFERQLNPGQTRPIPETVFGNTDSLTTDGPRDVQSESSGGQAATVPLGVGPEQAAADTSHSHLHPRGAHSSRFRAPGEPDQLSQTEVARLLRMESEELDRQLFGMTVDTLTQIAATQAPRQERQSFEATRWEDIQRRAQVARFRKTLTGPEPARPVDQRTLIIQKIYDDFHIRLDSAAGAAVLKEESPGAPEVEKNKIQPTEWDLETLKQVHAAMRHYAPILGPWRTDSSRAGVAQEVTTISRVTTHLYRDKVFVNATGKNFYNRNLINLYNRARSDIYHGPESIGWVLTHELAHALLGYVLPGFEKRFWEGIESPVRAASGVAAKNPEEDFRESIRSFLEDSERLADLAPRHHSAIARMHDRYPDVVTRRPGETAMEAVLRITQRLQEKLPWFTRKVGSWNLDGTRLLPVGLPSEYAGTDADEDLAETALYYFKDRPYLRKISPGRAAFFDALINAWPATTESPRSLQPAFSLGDQAVAGSGIGNEVASVGVEGHSSPDVIENAEQREHRLLVQRIKEEFGIRLDSNAGAAAVKEDNPDAPEAEKNKIVPLHWPASSLRQLYAAMKNYAPILGPQRASSSRAGIEQEVNVVGSVRSALYRKKAYFVATGQYFESQKVFNLYTNAHLKINGIERTATHELAHGLLKYALVDFTKQFWEGVESPWKLFGKQATTPENDFQWSIASYLQGNEKFLREAPRHAKAIEELREKWPTVVTKQSDESFMSAAVRIAHELKSEIPWFSSEVGTWENGRSRLAFPKERPITKYGETNADEDLADTAKYYFLENALLRQKAPLRAEFFDHLIKGWNERRGSAETHAVPDASVHDPAFSLGDDGAVSRVAGHGPVMQLDALQQARYRQIEAQGLSNEEGQEPKGLATASHDTDRAARANTDLPIDNADIDAAAVTGNNGTLREHDSGAEAVGAPAQTGPRRLATQLHDNSGVHSDANTGIEAVKQADSVVSGRSADPAELPAGAVSGEPVSRGPVAFLERPRPVVVREPNAEASAVPAVSVASADRRPTPKSVSVPHVGEGSTSNVPAGAFHEWVGVALQSWSGPVAEEVAKLERSLLAAGPGARSLVLGARLGVPLWAVNFSGTIRWREHTGKEVSAPQSAEGSVASITLDGHSNVIGPAARLLAQGGLTSRFCELNVGSDLTKVLGGGV